MLNSSITQKFKTTIILTLLVVGLSLVFFQKKIHDALAQFGPITNTVSCGENCSVKEIGTFSNSATGQVFNALSSGSTITQGNPYWVRLTIHGADVLTTPTMPPGSTPVPSGVISNRGSDIMLVLDTTGSMGETMKKYKDPGNSDTVQRAQAARASLQWFINNSDDNPSDGTVDHLGLGSFKYCEDYYTTTGVPITWVYGDNRPDDPVDREIGLGALHLNLQSLAGRKSTFNNALDNFFRPTGNPNFCNEELPGNETDTGAGVTVANTMLTPILSDAPQFRQSGSGFTGLNPGPLARDMSGNTIPKYIILASDGEQNVPPSVYDEEIDKKGRSIVETARQYNVRIYALAIDGEGEDPLLEMMARDTGGRFFTGRSEEELLEGYQAIRSEITSRGTSPSRSPAPSISPVITGSEVKIEEKINSSYFRIFDPIYNADINFGTFKITKRSGAQEVDITPALCLDGAGSPDCVTIVSRTGVNGITSLDITLNERLKSTDTRYIYFKVTPFASSNGEVIDVDNNGSNISKLEYLNLGEETDLDNTQVRIGEMTPYFTATGGDTYSGNTGNTSVNAIIPAGLRYAEKLNTGDSPLVISAGTGASFTPGIISETGRMAKNSRQTEGNITYDSLFEKYKQFMRPVDITGPDVLSQTGYYLHSPRSNNKDLTIRQGDTWDYTSNNGKKHVIFVPGDLYIRGNINISRDSKNLLMFIVGGNIGIDPAINDAANRKIQGVYIADGKIDTVCNSNFTNSGLCNPDSGSNSSQLRSALTLEGMFYSSNANGRGGFSLDRKGDVTSLGRGEKFIFRPEFLLSGVSTVGDVRYSWKEDNN